jgi:GNAT superfamily N-acetyltransferase
MMVVEVTRDGYLFSNDPTRLQVPVIHGFLTRCYWAEGIPEDTVRRSIAHSLCFGVYAEGQQVGFARVITDHATFAYLADVFVLPGHRGRGLAEQLLRLILAEPELQGLRRFLLGTRDAHGLYARLGFTAIAKPEIWMEISQLDIYTSPGDRKAIAINEEAQVS